MANTFDVAIEDLKSLTKDSFHKKFEGIKKHIDRNFFIKEYPPRSINANHIRNLLKELKVKKKFVPDIIYLDYLEILLPIHNSKNDNSYSEIKKISEEIRAIAVETRIPFISAVQTNRGGFGNSEIDLTDISQSIGTAATADLIIGVTQPDGLRELSKFSWIILKNRYGINKNKITICVEYYNMRVYEDEDQDSNVKIVGPKLPPSEKEKNQKVEEAIGDINLIIKKDTDAKTKKIIDWD
jgi:replicative DNA helicase